MGDSTQPSTYKPFSVPKPTTKSYELRMMSDSAQLIIYLCLKAPTHFSSTLYQIAFLSLSSCSVLGNECEVPAPVSPSQ